VGSSWLRSRLSWPLALVLTALILGGSAIITALIWQHSNKPSGPVAERVVRADPKTLVLQVGDYSANWTNDGSGDSPAVQPGPTVLDSYSTTISTSASSSLTSQVVLYDSSAAAARAFDLIYPPVGSELSFPTKGGSTPFAIGDAQKVFALGHATAPGRTIILTWRSGNVLATLLWQEFVASQAGTSDLTSFDGAVLLFFSELAPRMQTHIRLAQSG